MRYLTLSELIYINGSVLHNDQIRSGKRKVRDVELLDSAVTRPQSSAFGADAYPTLPDKAAALFHSLVRNHPFADGNKRTAAIAALLMFTVNGWTVRWDAEEALTMILRTAEGGCEVEGLAAWFPAQPGGEVYPADAERDKQIIADLITEHRWLLNELERR